MGWYLGVWSWWRRVFILRMVWGVNVMLIKGRMGLVAGGGWLGDWSMGEAIVWVAKVAGGYMDVGEGGEGESVGGEGVDG